MGASQSSNKSKSNPPVVTEENVLLKQSKLKASQFRAKGIETKLIQNTKRLQKECSVKLKTLQNQQNKISTDINKINTEFNRANLQLNAIKRRTEESNNKSNL